MGTQCKKLFDNEKRIQTQQIKVRVVPSVAEEFNEYCDRASITKSDLLRGFIDLLLDNPELAEHCRATGKSEIEVLDAMIKKNFGKPQE